MTALLPVSDAQDARHGAEMEVAALYRVLLRYVIRRASWRDCVALRARLASVAREDADARRNGFLCAQDRDAHVARRGTFYGEDR
jgi:hypothetical protein